LNFGRIALLQISSTSEAEKLTTYLELTMAPEGSDASEALKFETKLLKKGVPKVAPAMTVQETNMEKAKSGEV
jgi:hypothetical protein